MPPAILSESDLDPTQRELVRLRTTGPLLVRGGPATGKSSLLVHRAMHLAEQVFTAPDERLLLIAYTPAARLRLEAARDALGGPARQRVEVVNLHPWARSFLAERGRTFELVSPHRSLELWQRTYDELGGELGFPLDFFREEWERVVKAEDLLGRTAFLKSRRDGRGTRLVDRSQRLQVWDVLYRYRALLDDEGVMEWPDVIRAAVEVAAEAPPFRAVLVDDAHEFKPTELGLIRALAPVGPDDVTLVADPRQRLFGYPCDLSRHGLPVTAVRRLTQSHGAPEPIRAWTAALFARTPPDDLLGGPDDLADEAAATAGEGVVVRSFATADEEVAAVVERARSTSEAGASMAVTARTPLALEAFRAALAAAGVPVTDAIAGTDGVWLLPFQTMKDRAFDHVSLVGAGTDAVPFPRAAATFSDEPARQEFLMKERALLTLAASAARGTLSVSATGALSGLLPT